MPRQEGTSRLWIGFDSTPSHQKEECCLRLSFTARSQASEHPPHRLHHCPLTTSLQLPLAS